MPKIKEKPLCMTLELVGSDGETIEQKLLASEARKTFAFFVSDCLERYSKIREINLYDNAHRLWKTYKQMF